MVYVHLDPRTEPRDDPDVCVLCGAHISLHDDGECVPEDGISGVTAARLTDQQRDGLRSVAYYDDALRCNGTGVLVFDPLAPMTTATELDCPGCEDCAGGTEA